MATKVKEVVSEKGMKAWLVEEHTLPLVAIRVAFTGSGSAYDGEGNEGRANMVAAMLTEGAGDMNDREWNEALESRALEFNSSVDEDTLEVSMRALSEHKDTAFSYLGLALREPRFDSDAIDRTRRQSLSLLVQQEQSPRETLERRWRRQIYGDHPYAHMPLGSESSIRRLDRSDLREFAERHLTRENIMIAVVGDITPEELRLLLDKYLGGLPEHYKPEVIVPEAVITADGKPAVMDFDIPQTLVMFGTEGLKRNDPDYFTAHVMNQILGGDGALTSLLVQEIREKRGLAYSAYSAMKPLAHAASWQGGFATRNEQAGAALSVLQETLRRFAANGPTAAELATAKQYLVGSFMLRLNSNDDLASFLINMQFNNLGIDYLDRRNAMVAAVTRTKVKAMAKRLIDTDKLAIVMVGKPTLSPSAP